MKTHFASPKIREIELTKKQKHDLRLSPNKTVFFGSNSAVSVSAAFTSECKTAGRQTSCNETVHAKRHLKKKKEFHGTNNISKSTFIFRSWQIRKKTSISSIHSANISNLDSHLLLENKNAETLFEAN